MLRMAFLVTLGLLAASVPWAYYTATEYWKGNSGGWMSAMGAGAAPTDPAGASMVEAGPGTTN